MLVDNDLVADLEVIPVTQCSLLWQTNTARGIISGVAHVESVSVVGEVDCVRHRGVVELVRDLVLYLTVDVEGSPRCILARLARRHVGSHVRDLAIILQPGAAPVNVYAHISVRWARANIKGIALALSFCLTRCFFRTCLFSSYLCGTSLANRSQTLLFLTFFLSAQPRERDIQCVINHGLDLTRCVGVKVADLLQKSITRSPSVFAGLLEDFIKSDISRTLSKVWKLRQRWLCLRNRRGS